MIKQGLKSLPLQWTAPYLGKRTSAASKAVKRMRPYGTAEAVPFVQSLCEACEGRTLHG
jgi:hypothetical protein